MRESHKHLFFFLLAVTAFLWGITRRSFAPSPPPETRAVNTDAQVAPDAGVATPDAEPR